MKFRNLEKSEWRDYSVAAFKDRSFPVIANPSISRWPEDDRDDSYEENNEVVLIYGPKNFETNISTIVIQSGDGGYAIKEFKTMEEGFCFLRGMPDTSLHFDYLASSGFKLVDFTPAKYEIKEELTLSIKVKVSGTSSVHSGDTEDDVRYNLTRRLESSVVYAIESASININLHDETVLDSITVIESSPVK